MATLVAHLPGATGTISAAILGGPGQDRSPRRGKQNQELEKDSIDIILGSSINVQKSPFFLKYTDSAIVTEQFQRISLFVSPLGNHHPARSLLNPLLPHAISDACYRQPQPTCRNANFRTTRAKGTSERSGANFDNEFLSAV